MCLPLTLFSVFSSGLPYEVTPEQALTHPEVQQRIKQSIENLRTATEKFFNAILTSLNKIPWVDSFFVVINLKVDWSF